MEFNLTGTELKAGKWYVSDNKFIVHILNEVEGGCSIIDKYKHDEDSSMATNQHSSSAHEVYRIATREDHVMYKTGVKIYPVEIESVEDYEVW